MKESCLLGLLLITLNLVEAADSFFPVERYLSNDGLPNNSIKTVHIDKNGYLWAGTFKGLSRYNGYEFTNFYSESGNGSGLMNDNILDVTDDAYGNLLILNNYGIERFHPDSEHFETLLLAGSNHSYFQIKSSLRDSVVYVASYNKVLKLSLSRNSFLEELFYQIADAGQSIVSISIVSSNICVATKKKILVFSIDDGLLKESISVRELSRRPAEIIKIASISENCILVQTSRNIVVYDLNEGKSKSTSKSIGVSNNKIITASQTNISSEITYFAYNNRVFSVNIVSGRINKLEGFDFFQKSGFNIQSIYLEKSGILWIGTNVGLHKYNSKKKLHLIPFNALKNNIRDVSVVKNVDDNIILLTDLRNNYYWIFGFSQPDNQLLVEQLEFNGEVSFVRMIDSMLVFNSGSGINVLIDSKVQNIDLSGFLDLYINDVTRYDNGNLILATDSGVLKGRFDLSQNVITEIDIVLKDPNIKYLSCIGDKLIALSGNSTIYEIDLLYNVVKNIVPPGQSNPLAEITDLLVSSDSILWIGTMGGIFNYSPGDSLAKIYSNLWENHTIYSITEDARGRICFTTDMGMAIITKPDNSVIYLDYVDGLDQYHFTSGASAKFEDEHLCFPTQDGLLVVHPDSLLSSNHSPRLKISKTRLYFKNSNSYLDIAHQDTLRITSDVNYFQVELNLLDFYSPERNSYSYALNRVGRPTRWIDNGNKREIILTNLISGIYNLELNAKNSRGVESIDNPSVLLVMDTSFWLSRIAFFGYGLILLLIIYLSIFFRTRHLRRLNREYKEKEIIARQVERQKEELSIKNKNITDSIYYAKRIQMAMMPSKKIFMDLFPESFILHMPKDIVSGDFYWANQVDGRIFFSAVDCTGHGVPGAFMSIIGFELFRRITEIDKIAQPAEILNNLGANFERLFRDVDDFKLRDGMDLAFCAVDKEKKILEYSGAFNPLYLIRDNSIMEIKGDRFSVGLNDEDGTNHRFNNHVVPLQAGDIIYIFTDGYADQFGGPDGKKYKYRRFRHLLLALHQLPMDRQEEFLKKSILEWKADQDQVDDVLVMGIRIS